MAIDELLKDLQRRKGKALEMGGAGKVSKHRATGSGTARDRIAALLDPDSFYEIGLLNHSDVAGMEARTAALRAVILAVYSKSTHSTTSPYSIPSSTRMSWCCRS